MLRITVLSICGSTVHLKVEGRLAENWVAELDRECQSYFSQDKRPLLDLSDITFVDHEGIEALKRIKCRGGKVDNASLLVQALLNVHGHS